MGGRLVAVNGIELWVEQFGAAEAAPVARPGIVLVSGAASASDWWDDALCEALAADGHRVTRYDLRDTGQSTTCPLGAPDYTGNDLVGDLAGLVRALHGGRAHVVGLSLGGGLAQQLAIAHPELVVSLVLFSTSPGGPDSDGLPPMSPALAAAFAEPQPETDWSDRDAVFRAVLRDERLFGGVLAVDEGRIRRISDRIVDRSIDLAAGANHWAIPSASGTRAQLAEVAAPTLVVHGTADPLFPIGHGEALAREIPDARLLPVPGLGHQFPPPETWALIVPAVLAHVAGAEAGSAGPSSAAV
ncbi:MAG: alpha/beta hydrolase [Herbiconiux sp.]|nr:alpha/beta hydrolase [Herbiconiux sp.]